jgi:hypothetical protein
MISSILRGGGLACPDLTFASQQAKMRTLNAVTAFFLF